MVGYKIVLTLGMIASFVCLSDAIRCFNCRSDIFTNCAKTPFNTSATNYVVDCATASGAQSCSIVTVKFENKPDLVVRGCSKRLTHSDCYYDVSNLPAYKQRQCFECTGIDLCNGATKTIFSSMLLISVIGFFTIIKTF